ncbi:SLBB domain-containing protein [Desulfovibrio sp. OttesenSCG-928-G15]|nr:SLBB domain-containing protein [Desulfovibrio sp. OttesenSCG-928-G15]
MKATILEKIRNAGVVGAGGAGLPAHVKADATVDTVLVNGASCEPLLMSDPHLMQAEVATMLSGLKSLMGCTGATRGIVCLKGKHREAMQSVRDAVARDGAGKLEVFELGDFYPAGDEHVLVNEVLGRTVPERGLPLQVGAVVANVESLYNLALAMQDKPVTHRYLTVTGEVKRHAVLKVPVGTQVAEVLAWAGGPTVRDYKIVDGGPMMGRVLPDANRPVTKTTSGLIVLPPDHTVVARKIMDPETVRRITATICCQCSMCTDLCPRRLLGHSLHPHKLMRVHKDHIVESPIAREALLCSECGVCEKFACPMFVSPREVNAQIKQVLMKEGVRWEASGKEPQPSAFRGMRHIPTSRLVQRLGLSAYDTHPHYEGELHPNAVTIPLRQHIGAPASCVVKLGDRVRCGDLVGEIPDGAMGARVHASIDGTVQSIDNGLVTISASGM